nr:hypothetical protein [Tanacetum cinerariifolium]
LIAVDGCMGPNADIKDGVLGVTQCDVHKFHNSIIKYKMMYKGNNVVRALMNVPIFVGTFSVVTDFAALENMDAYRDEGMGVYNLEDVEVNLEEAQATTYNLDLQHLKKVLSMQDIDEEEPAEVEEVLEVVTAAKLIKEVVTTTEPTTTAAQVPKVSAPRRRRGVVIVEPHGGYVQPSSLLIFLELLSCESE